MHLPTNGWEHPGRRGVAERAVLELLVLVREIADGWSQRIDFRIALAHASGSSRTWADGVQVPLCGMMEEPFGEGHRSNIEQRRRHRMVVERRQLVSRVRLRRHARVLSEVRPPNFKDTMAAQPPAERRYSG